MSAKKSFLLLLYLLFLGTAYSRPSLKDKNIVTIEGYYYWVSFFHNNNPPLHTSVFATERIHTEDLKCLTLKKVYKRLYKNNYHCQDIMMGYREYYYQKSTHNQEDFDYGLAMQDSIATHSTSTTIAIRDGYECIIEESKIKGLFWFISETSQMSDEIPFSKLGITPKSLVLIDLYDAKEP